MGLSTMSGDQHSLYEETKIAAQSFGVEPIGQMPIAANPVPDEMPAQVNQQVQPLGQPTSSAPALKAPEPVPKVEPPLPSQSLYSNTPESLPPMTRTSEYKGSKMSKLRQALNKSAAYMSDIEGQYADMEYSPDQAPGTLGTFESMENYNQPPDYSNYLASNASSAAPASYDIGEDEMEAIYGDVNMYDSPEAAEQAAMQAASEYEQMGYSPEVYQAYEQMGYSPEVYQAYEQMYATPEAGAAEYQDLQTSAVDPEQQAYLEQKAVYDQSYNEIYNYLVQMGYSPEEAEAAVPSLLGQVSVQAPQAPMQQTKTASYMFKEAAARSEDYYIDAGYSPYQAREMAAIVVIPQAEKYASQARLIGGTVGALAGGAGGHYMYDDEGEIGGALTTAAIGGLLGATMPQRIHSYSVKGLLGRGKSNITNANLAETRQKLMEAARKDMESIKAQQAANGVTPASRKAFGAARNALQEAERGTHADLIAAAQIEAAAARKADTYKALSALVPGVMVHRYAASHGGDNLVDNAFEGLDYLGDRAIDAARPLANPTVLLGAGGAYAGYKGVEAIKDMLEERRESGPKKKGRTKKAQIDNHIAELQALQGLEKQASMYGRIGGALAGGMLGHGVMNTVGADDSYIGQAIGVGIGALGGARIGKHFMSNNAANLRRLSPLQSGRNIRDAEGILAQAKATNDPVAIEAAQAALTSATTVAPRGYLGNAGASALLGTAGGATGGVYRELERAEQGDGNPNYLAAAVKGGATGMVLGGLAGLGRVPAKGVAAASLAYPGYYMGKRVVKRTGQAASDALDAVTPPEELVRAFGEGIGEAINPVVSGARSVKNMAASASQAAAQEGKSLVEWAKENPALAAAAGIGTAGALYGGYRMLANREPSYQEKIEALRKRRNY